MALNTFKTLPLLPREPFVTIIGKDFNGNPIYDMSPAWRLFFEQLQPLLGNVSGLDWQVIDKSQSRLEEIGNRPHSALQAIQGEGDLHVSAEQISKWDNLSVSNNAAILHWFF